METQRLPNELLIHIGEAIASTHNLNIFVKVSKFIYRYLNPLLYRRNAGAPTCGLEWAAQRTLIGTATHFLAAGTNINRCVTRMFHSSPLTYHDNPLECSWKNIRLQERMWTPLWYAIVANQKSMVRFLVENGADLEFENKLGKTAIVLAISYRNAGMVKLLLELGAAHSHESKRIGEPLYFAICHGSIKIVRMLLDAGADPNQLDDEDLPAIYNAISSDRLRMTKLLLHRGALLEGDPATSNGVTPLAMAAGYGCVKIVRLLIRRGADINATDLDGHTPLFRAIFVANGEAAAKLLIDSGAAFDTSDHNGTRPLHSACQCGRVELVKYLLEKGADPVRPTLPGSSPMYFAADAGHLDAIQVLVDHGVEIDDYSRTALNSLWKMAVMDDDTERLEALEKIGFVPDDSDGFP